MPRGYVSSEAYGVNNHRVVFGLLYDKKERTFPFRWKDGRMRLLKGPNGRVRQADAPDRNTINERGEIAGTLLVAGNRRAVRWTPQGQGELPPGAARAHLDERLEHRRGRHRVRVVAQAAERRRREQPRHLDEVRQGDRAEDRAGPCRRGRRADQPLRPDGRLPGQPRHGHRPRERPGSCLADASGEPQLLGPATTYAYAELVDVNDRGQAAGTSGTFTAGGFPVARPAIWRTGWSELRTLPLPAATRHHRVVVGGSNDINAHGAIAGNVYGLSGKDFSKLERVYPVVWKCAFGR